MARSKWKKRIGFNEYWERRVEGGYLTIKASSLCIIPNQANNYNLYFNPDGLEDNVLFKSEYYKEEQLQYAKRDLYQWWCNR